MAILAVLASAIAAGSGSFNGDISAVSAKAQASAILGYANEVKFAVDRLIAKGCTDTEISFENPIASGYTNPNAPSDKSCHVFDVNGGGVLFNKYHPSCSNINFKTNHALGHNMKNIGDSEKADIYMRLSYCGILLCNAYNNLVGINNLVNYDGHMSTDNFVGTYLDGGGFYTPNINILGKHSYCATFGGGDYIALYFVILAR
ncbi:MAG: hypothetical protein IPI58_02380 [Alphaproteobacteria bacterium]|nr:MAG: hypothetical protein IPI58_02380 [Alphaproteobacteria bacterium]